MGYALFIVIAALGGWFAIPIMMVALPLSFLLSLLKLPLEAHIAAGAFLSGCLWGVFMFLDALIAVKWLNANPDWITGIGVALMVFACPRVQNARYAVPGGILTFFLMSCWLL